MAKSSPVDLSAQQMTHGRMLGREF